MLIIGKEFQHMQRRHFELSLAGQKVPIFLCRTLHKSFMPQLTIIGNCNCNVRARLYPTELRCTILSYARPTQLHCTLRSLVSALWAELHFTFLSWVSPYWISIRWFEIWYSNLIFFAHLIIISVALTLNIQYMLLIHVRRRRFCTEEL